MTDGPQLKKFRIWNPAIQSENHEESEERKTNLTTQDEEKPLDCTSKNGQFQLPEVFQNYLQLAPLMLRLQQQRQMEELARRQFFSQICHVAPIPPVASQNPRIPRMTSSATSSKNSGIPLQMTNPLVATALGNSVVNENCCAVCGAQFRLTGDLVQHMRNNHRKTKFKRKADFHSKN
ncbi:hypothetical protein L3Y34_005375 [Caenorhabditis briggsae]|nr:hypothetical protein L3Y34_005375 [Caenorhabditis briggsae]